MRGCSTVLSSKGLGPRLRGERGMWGDLFCVIARVGASSLPIRVPREGGDPEPFQSDGEGPTGILFCGNVAQRAVDEHPPLPTLSPSRGERALRPPKSTPARGLDLDHVARGDGDGKTAEQVLRRAIGADQPLKAGQGGAAALQALGGIDPAAGQ